MIVNFIPIRFHMQTGYFIAHLLINYLIFVIKSFDRRDGYNFANVTLVEKNKSAANIYKFFYRGFQFILNLPRVLLVLNLIIFNLEKILVFITNAQEQSEVKKELEEMGSSYRQIATLQRGITWLTDVTSHLSCVNQLLIKWPLRWKRMVACKRGLGSGPLLFLTHYLGNYFVENISHIPQQFRLFYMISSGNFI